MKPLSVLQVIPSFAPAYQYGGPIRSVEGLVVALAERGIDVRVLTTDADGGRRLEVPSDWTTWRGVPVRYVRRWAEPEVAPTLLAYATIGARKADIVHVHGMFSTSSMFGVVAAQVTGRPLVFSPRGALQRDALAMGASAAKRVWLSAARPFLTRAVIHATSTEELDAARAALGPETRAIVVPNGVELETVAAATQRRERVRRVSPRRRIVGALGRIHVVKALDRLINAFRMLGPGFEDVHLHIAGPQEDAAHMRELQRLVTQNGLTERVTFDTALTGDAKLDFLAACDVLCLVSHTENFGNVVPEALAAFTPVIASTGTPWQQLVMEDAGQWIPNAPESIAQAMRHVLMDSARARATAERGRSLVERLFTWPAVAERMAAAYELERSSRRGSFAPGG